MSTREEIEADAHAEAITASRLAAGDFDGPDAEWHYHEVPNGSRHGSIALTYTDDGETDVLIELTPSEAAQLAQRLLTLLKQR